MNIRVLPSSPRYSISDTGDVYGVKGNLLKAVPNSQTGYLSVNIHYEDGRKPRFRTVHSLVMEAFVGPRPEGQEVRHLNGVRTDNQLGNLAYGSSHENKVDLVRHGNHHWANKTHCPQGHEYTSENTHLARLKSGGVARSCKICRNAEQRRRRRRIAGPPKPPPTHCKRGHEFTPENTGRQRSGRFCRTCLYASRRARAVSA